MERLSQGRIPQGRRALAAGWGLKQEMTKLHKELQQSQEEARAFLTKKSNEALELSNKNMELQAEVETLKGDMAKKDE